MASFVAGNSVRYTTDGRVGIITGKFDKFRDRWQVKFNGVDLIWVPGENLEVVPDKEDPFDLFQNERFMSISDFRRCLYRYRMSGELTNIMYSMDNAVATFMPHQFIPVIKFLESYTERLLIADEVGLGKTIEAMYIWEELRARKNAKRLLVVVPAVLRDKWKGDMERFFGIDAEIVSAQCKDDDHALLRRVEDVRRNPNQTNFALIVSIEGLRTADKVRDIFKECKDVEQLFDLTIIDEAHYYRNKERKTFDTGEELRDVSHHFLLLSATPIQTSSENFFNLLRLLAPEDFENQDTFHAQLAENRPLVCLANALERHDNKEVVEQYLKEALYNEVFERDADLNYFSRNLDLVVDNPQERVVMIKKIKDKYFYAGLVTRSRKRDVMPNRTQRCVQPVNFRLSEYEHEFYDEVTRYLRGEDQRNERSTIFSTFRLIMRQRQMASCIPAALRAWRGLGVNENEDDGEEESSSENFAIQKMTEMPRFENYDLDWLEANDSKFNRVLAEVQKIIAANPHEKIVIFTFFRTTARYLNERLKDNHISTTLLMGGVDRDEKSRQLEAFKKTSVNVFVSTEVGSEGIDLQFARYELNYDLPWNPMRLEQRIGRIDRIGQEANPVYICNAYCENTIEDRILQRLYERIEIFKNVIGDVEEILGEKTEEFARDVFRAGELTEEEMNARTEQVVNAMYHQQEIARNLELESGIMSSEYQNYILGNISKARETNRLLTAPELMFFCRDVLQEKFIGSSVAQVSGTSVADIKLSEEARRELMKFTTSHPMGSYTQLGSVPSGLRCNFGKKCPESVSLAEIHEIIDVNHPLVRWLLDVIEKSAIYASGCDVISISRKDVPHGCNMEPGYFSFGIMHWKTSGVKKVNELRYYLSPGQYDESVDAGVLSGEVAEQLLVATMMSGKAYDINLLTANDYNACGISLGILSQKMEDEFHEFYEEQNRLNKDLVVEQSKYVERTASIKAGKLQATINKLCVKGNEQVAKMNQGKLEKMIRMRDERIARIKDRLDCSPEYQIVALGILHIRED